MKFPSIIEPNKLASALQNSQVQQTSSGGGGQSFVRFDFETGEFSHGRHQEDLTGVDILVNTSTYRHGWVLWVGGRPTKVSVPFTEELPQPMANVGEDYPSEMRGFDAALMDDGTQLAFETSSYGGRKGADVLLGEIKAKAATGSAYLYPLVTLTSESYPNAKRGGRLTYNPVFEVVGWFDQEGNEEGGTPALVEDRADEKPMRRRRATA